MESTDVVNNLEAIKQLKARYCRLLDAKDWQAWRDILTDDFVSDTRESGGKKIEGGDAFVAFVRKMLGKPHQLTAHQVHAPELELLSDSEARGIWALEDFVRLMPGISMRGYGHYHETYEKVGGQWRIGSSTLTRLRMDLVTPILTFNITGLLRRK